MTTKELNFDWQPKAKQMRNSGLNDASDLTLKLNTNPLSYFSLFAMLLGFIILNIPILSFEKSNLSMSQ